MRRKEDHYLYNNNNWYTICIFVFYEDREKEMVFTLVVPIQLIIWSFPFRSIQGQSCWFSEREEWIE